MPLMNWEDAAYLRKDADGSFIPLVGQVLYVASRVLKSTRKNTRDALRGPVDCL